MKTWITRRALFSVCFLLWLSAGCSHQQKQPAYWKDAGKGEYITIATGGEYGPYFTIGRALAEIYSEEAGVNATVQTTGGSVENLRLLKDGKADVAFVMSDVASFAYEGQKVFAEPYQDFQVMASLYLNYVQIVTLKDAGIQSVGDLAGKRVGVGAPNSGVEVNAKVILKAHGLSGKDYQPFSLSYHEAMEQLKHGEIDAAFVTSGLPNVPAAELAREKEITIVPIYLSDMKGEEMSAPYFQQTHIPPHTYENSGSIPTIGIQNLLVVRNTLDEQLIERLRQIFYEHLDELKDVHRAMEGVPE
jgi:TRAP transporter TAXI family solute receptor